MSVTRKNKQNKIKLNKKLSKNDKNIQTLNKKIFKNIKNKAKKTYRKFKGGICNDSSRTCSGSRSACCDRTSFSSPAARLCHFTPEIIEKWNTWRESGRIGPDPTKIINDEQGIYKHLESSNADLIYEKDRYNNPLPTYYNNSATQEGIEILKDIANKRNDWTIKYLKPECYYCDANCVNHKTRADKAQQAADISQRKLDRARTTRRYNRRARRQGTRSRSRSRSR